MRQAFFHVSFVKDKYLHLVAVGIDLGMLGMLSVLLPHDVQTNKNTLKSINEIL